MMLTSMRSQVVTLSLLLLTFGCTTPIATTPSVETSKPAGSTTLTIDGSSTVFPISDEVAKEYQFEKSNQAPTIDVAFSGTSGGFKKFCAGETDINNASRPITKDEMAQCKQNGIEYIELPVAFDALTVVVHRDNDWASDITVAELKRLWEPGAEGKITRWNQIRPEWPDQPITLYGAGQDSGTFDYFTEAIVGESGASRTDYTASEDDTELVRGVRTDPQGLGYFGYAYYEESQTALKALGIDSGDGAVLPSDETVRSGAYRPLTRPLLIYVSVPALDQKPELEAFVQYYLANVPYLVSVVGYTSLPEDVYALAQDHLQNRKVGTVFGGEAPTDLTLQELLEKEAAF